MLIILESISLNLKKSKFQSKLVYIYNSKLKVQYKKIITNKSRNDA